MINSSHWYDPMVIDYIVGNVGRHLCVIAPFRCDQNIHLIYVNYAPQRYGDSRTWVRNHIHQDRERT